MILVVLAAVAVPAGPVAVARSLQLPVRLALPPLWQRVRHPPSSALSAPSEVLVGVSYICRASAKSHRRQFLLLLALQLVLLLLRLPPVSALVLKSPFA